MDRPTPSPSASANIVAGKTLWQRCLLRLRPYALPLLLSALLGLWATTTIVARAGEPALPLDDSFIHLQYARRLSQGHWFSYVPGDGYSTGATSWLWALLLAPFYWLGLDGLQLVWIMWLFGMLLHAALALEAFRLTEGLAGRVAAYGSAGMCLAFAGYAWFAYSGMETLGLAWVLLRGARVAAERWEQAKGWEQPRRPPSWGQLAALGVLAPLIRPEGALVSLLAAFVGLRELRSAVLPWWRRLAPVLLPLAGPAIIPLSHLAFAGHSASSTAMVKWWLLDPYVDRAGAWDATQANVHLLITDLLNGGGWTQLFVPEGSVWLLAAGVVGVLLAARRRGRWMRGFLLLAIVAATLAPCTYITMLWNRVRYIWPFAGAWMVCAACAIHELGELLAKRKQLLRIVAPALLGGAVAVLAVKLPAALDDVAQSARAIRWQQVELGRWAATALPADARIGVNDTGAIAYFSRRPTFDVVGLTSEGEARYWAAGSGSRFEHYERLARERLPTHFIVYPNWMAMTAVLGPQLHSATVVEQSILGGQTMVAYRARYDLLHSGALPSAGFTADAALLFEVDVSDLESEANCGYQLLDAKARFNRSRWSYADNGRRALADGGRMQRRREVFTLPKLPASRMLARVNANAPLELWAGGKRLTVLKPLDRSETWQERSAELPALEGQHVEVRTADGSLFDAYHYWWFKR